MVYYNLIKFVLLLDKMYRQKSEKIPFLVILASKSNESYSLE